MSTLGAYRDEYWKYYKYTEGFTVHWRDIMAIPGTSHDDGRYIF